MKNVVENKTKYIGKTPDCDISETVIPFGK